MASIFECEYILDSDSGNILKRECKISKMNIIFPCFLIFFMICTLILKIKLLNEKTEKLQPYLQKFIKIATFVLILEQFDKGNNIHIWTLPLAVIQIPQLQTDVGSDFYIQIPCLVYLFLRTNFKTNWSFYETLMSFLLIINFIFNQFDRFDDNNNSQKPPQEEDKNAEKQPNQQFQELNQSQEPNENNLSIQIEPQNKKQQEINLQKEDKVQDNKEIKKNFHPDQYKSESQVGQQRISQQQNTEKQIICSIRNIFNQSPGFYQKIDNQIQNEISQNLQLNLQKNKLTDIQQNDKQILNYIGLNKIIMEGIGCGIIVFDEQEEILEYNLQIIRQLKSQDIKQAANKIFFKDSDEEQLNLSQYTQKKKIDQKKITKEEEVSNSSNRNLLQTNLRKLFKRFQMKSQNNSSHSRIRRRTYSHNNALSFQQDDEALEPYNDHGDLRKRVRFMNCVFQIYILFRMYEGQKIIMIILAEQSETEEFQTQYQQKFKSKLLQSICHSIRTPLNCSYNMSQLLLEKIENQFIREQLVEPLFASNVLINNFVNDLQDLQALDFGQFQLKFYDFDLREMLKYCLSLYKMQAQLKSITLIAQIDEDVPLFIHNDPDRLKQILINLLNNSLKFTREGTIKILVSIARQKEKCAKSPFEKWGNKSCNDFREESKEDQGSSPKSSVNSYKSRHLKSNLDNLDIIGDLIQIIVQDTGSGMSLLDQKQLKSQLSGDQDLVNFQDSVKFQDSESIKSQFQLKEKRGCGLGLLITSKIVKGLCRTNNAIQFESKLGEGTTFQFCIQNRHPEEKGTKLKKIKLLSKDTFTYKTIYKKPSQISIINQLRDNDSLVENSSSGKSQKHHIYELKQTNNFFFDKELLENNDNSQDLDVDLVNQSDNINDCSLVESEGENISQYSLQGGDQRDAAHQINILEVHLASYKKKICQCSDILIVDDEAFNQHILKNIISRYGLTADIAMNGQEAFDKIQDKYSQLVCCRFYLLIFMDIDMPVMNGLVCTQKLGKFYKTQKLTKKSLICIHSAFIDKNTEDKAKGLGASLFLKKPAQIDKIEQILITIFPMCKFNLKN